MATFFFLMLSICIFAGLICYSMSRSIKMARADHMSTHEKAAWDQIKTAIWELHSRYESTETPKQKALRSWAGTLVICAGLCMIGIVMEAQYNSFISPRTVISNLLGTSDLRRGQWHQIPTHHTMPEKQMPEPTKKL
jgi:hypothetical protein